MLVLSFRSMSARIAKVAVPGSQQRRPLGSNILHALIPIAGCRERSRIVGRQRYPGRRPYQVSARVYQECQAVSWSRAHGVQQDKSNARPTTARFLFPRPKKRAKQGFPRLRNYNTFAKSRHFAPHGSFILCVQFSSVTQRGTLSRRRSTRRANWPAGLPGCRSPVRTLPILSRPRRSLRVESFGPK